jgi:hypothetical protein
MNFILQAQTTNGNYPLVVKLIKTSWTSHEKVDKLESQIEARSNASGLTPPK